MQSPRKPDPTPHTISIVIPVYSGEKTLEALVGELGDLTSPQTTPEGQPFRVTEIVLVYDNGTDQSGAVIRQLAAASVLVKPVWLSRNFGQHAATLAGISSSTAEWIVTMDEDGQQDPRDIGRFLDVALSQQAQVVYGRPINPPPHGALRNWLSRTAKGLASRLLLSSDASAFNSYRLLLGSVARGMAAYAGAGAYLDVALGWVVGGYATAPTALRGEGRPSAYGYRKLISHFWRLVISSGTRALRIVSALGVAVATAGVAAVMWVLVVSLTTGNEAEGWASTMVVILLTSGATLFSLGVVAEYVGVNVNMAMGKPAYLIVTDPADGPLGRHTPIT